MENELETKKDGLERFFLYIGDKYKEEITDKGHAPDRALEEVRENIINNIEYVFGELSKHYEDSELDKIRESGLAKNELLSFSEKIFKEIRSVLTPETKKYFAIPSNAYMYLILPLFSGLTKRIPHKLLTEKYNSKEAKDYINNVLQMNTIVTKDEYYQPQTITKTVAIIQDNDRIKATADIPDKLFNDIESKEADLALRLKHTFGAKGIKHFLGYLLQLDRHGRNGQFIFNVNEHLKLLGYKKLKHGDYDPEEKKLAGQIFDIMTSIFITVEKKDNRGNAEIATQPLFGIDGMSDNKIGNKLVGNTKYLVSAKSYWYGDSFKAIEGKRTQQYTKLLEKIVKESAKDRPHTLYLAPLFAVQWRQNDVIRWNLSTVLEWLGITLDGNTEHRKQKLLTLETELRYMQNNGYLGEMKFIEKNAKGDTIEVKHLSYKNLEATLYFYPPKELREQLEAIATKRQKHIESATRKELAGDVATVTKEEFISIMERSGLNQKQFANTLGISPTLISKVKKGEKPISKELNFRLLELKDELKINS